ncbi:MAG TPA: efflux RND transporter permease subunit [bacterium]|nr:efflux RND transporter permease subunit [bacterium]
MQWLAELSVRRPILASVLILTLVFLGVFSYYRLNVERWPNVDIPFVGITTRVPGASPEEVESDVTDKLEAAVNTISGINTLSSTSAEGFSLIFIEFLLEKDIDVAVQEVRDKVNVTLADLPAEIDPPVIERFDPGATPVLMYALSANRPIRDITEYADKVIRPALEGTAGVGQVQVVGGQARQINILVDPAKLQAYGLSVTDVIRTLQAQNVQVPAGSLDQGAERLTIRTLGRVTSLAQLERVVIASRDRVPIALSEIARIEDGAAEAETVANVDGERAVILRVVKQSGSNTLEVVEAVKEKVHAIEATLAAGYHLQLIRDQAVFVEASTHAVQEHLILGSILAALVVLVFLWNWRSTIIAAIAIPTSLISTFALLSAMGLTLNTITLLALALVVGIVIDDAIVVLENIYRFIHEKGLPPVQAAIEGTREIGPAVSATTLSLIAVFLPLAFMGGIVGRFMASFGYTMAFAIGVSLLVSFTLTPSLAARWLSRRVRAGNAENAPAGEATIAKPPESRGRIYGTIERWYLRLLGASLRRRWVVGILILVTLFSIAPLGAAVNQNFLPEDDESQFDVVIRAPEGWTLEATERLANQMGLEIHRLPGVAHTVVTVADDAQRTPNRFSLFVKLADVNERRVSQHALMARVRDEVLPRYAHLGLRTKVSLASEFGEGFEPINYVISGPDLAVLTRAAEVGEKALREIPGVVDVNSSLISRKPQLGITVDRMRAADLGVSVMDAAMALRVLVGGVEVSTFTEGGEQYEVHMRAEAAYRRNLEGLSQLTTGSASLGALPLEQVVRIERGVGPSVIDRFNRRRQVTLTANLLPNTDQAGVMQQLDSTIRGLGLPAGYATNFAGAADAQGEQAAAFMTAFMLSFVFMYLVLAAQFESWIHPITILLSLPLTVPFALLSILLLQGSLNILSQLGILVLFGVVKKNAILQIDHANRLRARGLDRNAAIIAASRDRLRPILMTTIAFVAGMIPLAISRGVGAETNRAMSSVIIGGQVLSLVLTLVAIPVIYSLFDDLTRLRVWSRVTRPVRILWTRFAARLTARRPARSAPELLGGDAGGGEGE